MKLWQKETSTNEKIDHFTVGNDRTYDLVLAPYDCIASKAHAHMLGKIGLLLPKEVEKLTQALNTIQESAEQGDFEIEKEFEDMHSKIEFILTEKLGDLGKKIHTARSRNDQVLVAIQLFIKTELTQVKKEVVSLFDLLMDLAERHQNDLLPGYTHMQVAMPSSFGLWFSAYAESLIDDVAFLNTAIELTDQNPLGSAAGFGSSFPIDREMTTKELNFKTLKYNVVAAQMGRGKIEKATATTLGMLSGTLAKLAMDVCMYMGQDFDFIYFPEELTTGSSIMPHKKNPDVFELIRGKCNLLQGLPQQLALLTSNLPSGYHREMQLAKGPIIEAFQEIKACLEMMRFSLSKIQVRKNITADSKYDYLFSVDTLNEWVKQGVPFREAYQKMGKEIATGNYTPKRNLDHSHQGSLGNLQLENIRQKMNSVKN
ncbi:MAG: argininosuccinate lyase [Flavobacteriaceae bacterium]|nr:argininosuccinate lyase [Flavobacteriaceae bacterium]MDG2387426.1 argininosuccinate lyase [Flavobacteriaceae bacterium]